MYILQRRRLVFFSVSVRSPLIQCTRPTHPKVNSNSLLILWQSAYEQNINGRPPLNQCTKHTDPKANRNSLLILWQCAYEHKTIVILRVLRKTRIILFWWGDLILTGQTCLTEKLFWWLAQSTTCFTRHCNNGNLWRIQYTDDVQQTWMSTATHH